MNINTSKILKKGDIVKVQSVHSKQPHCYEISRFGADLLQNPLVISQPADFKHRISDIIAVYRYDGKDYKCIWSETK